ncbi:hypothetical protein [Orenia marismortui]|uniref:Uncharacterized protein n=1 Tax=Orenia marismortui TaxID=46469 RepID=A0A4R8H9W4_9FIRM|nr:hypothetical protein [Orenia marismortui]TDX52973.1 hypothetical protein C7959_104101 [Orenia marismortui]
MEKIKEKNSDDFCFEVRHKVLEIPRNTYIKALSNFENPFSEEAAQQLIEEYLDWKDDNGLLGMIRINEIKKDNLVELDAAVRYVVNCEPSTCQECQ